MVGPLTSAEKKSIVDLYEGRYDEFGFDVRTIGWSSKQSQFLRFSVLSRGLNFDGKRILDVGCGFGDFVHFLEDRGCSDFDYVGIDIAPKLIAEAKRRLARPNCSFMVGSLFELRDLQHFDLIICSGALTLRIGDNLAMAKVMLEKMFELSRQATAVNFMSTYVDYQVPKNYHYRPDEMLEWALSLTRWVRLYHDYPLYEFTLQLFHEATEPST